MTGHLDFSLYKILNNGNFPIFQISETQKLLFHPTIQCFLIPWLLLIFLFDPQQKLTHIIVAFTTQLLFFKNCQNPNLTTTQPQPNLNLVGFDTIITFHTHPPPELYFYQK